jgi:His/Glu/Gln/Arg/opine family amino acid ABC transporter permease subunit
MTAIAAAAGVERPRWSQEAIWRAGLLCAVLAGLWAARDAGWDVVWNARSLLLEGLANTWLLTILSVSIGLPAGILLALGRIKGPPGMRHLAAVVVELVRAVPQLMVIFWVFYTWPAMTGRSVSGWAAGVVSLSLVAAAYLAEVFRAGVASVPRVQAESAYATGLSSTQAFLRVVLPQAARNMLPALISCVVMMFKTTSLVYVVGIVDFFRAVIIVNNRDFAPGALYLTMGAVYFLCCWALTALSRRLEPKYTITS